VGQSWDTFAAFLAGNPRTGLRVSWDGRDGKPLHLGLGGREQGTRGMVLREPRGVWVHKAVRFLRMNLAPRPTCDRTSRR
jgi:hypothetical protein